jgi:hypothetical protein
LVSISITFNNFVKKRKMKKLVSSMTILTLAGFMQIAVGVDYSIYDLQYQSDPEDLNSPHVGEDVNCIGGIVIDKFLRNKAKLTLYDPQIYNPSEPNGWRGIMVKTAYGFNPNVFDNIDIGDWVSFNNVLVKDNVESQYNTMLEYGPTSSFTIESMDNPLHEPIVISPNDIASPVFDSGPPWSWRVNDHRAEKYEAMMVEVRNVRVTQKGLGKYGDNYILVDHDSNDSNNNCWAADYMNEEVEEDGYHRFVDLGSRFCSVTGIIEQYKQYDSYAEIDWDYYQLLTTSTDSFVKTDLDGDCDFDFVDFSVFAQHWLTEEQCADPNWCDGADLTQNGTVDISDLKEFSEYWLEGK